ncbi:DUF397 domain-containing protein [Streptomyces sp. AV19]|uniref:DUF397 domain-containing protein n=1 Tax=Streptomyces sp. AV19 TaxID=2793068 RepID=UPI0018FE8F33|nr:DUF397 domain-containing protein [Streptomyces sp. AV19]MBH1936193.1 DUF397 domain-containing protein [Streptomyces sp. AV19]MDG4534619.1 DUF397 domain-containing protein [Streptomyces sp. AV19]
MSDPEWQKSSYSGGGAGGECVELTAGHRGAIRIREGAHPATVLTPAPAAVHALLAHARRGSLDRP